MNIYGWVLFNDPRDAEGAKGSLEAEEYRVELLEEDGAVVLQATPTASLTPEALRTSLASVAENFGGEFLGHGGSHQVVLRGRS